MTLALANGRVAAMIDAGRAAQLSEAGDGTMNAEGAVERGLLAGATAARGTTATVATPQGRALDPDHVRTALVLTRLVTDQARVPAQRTGTALGAAETSDATAETIIESLTSVVTGGTAETTVEDPVETVETEEGPTRGGLTADVQIGETDATSRTGEIGGTVDGEAGVLTTPRRLRLRMGPPLRATTSKRTAETAATSRRTSALRTTTCLAGPQSRSSRTSERSPETSPETWA